MPNDTTTPTDADREAACFHGIPFALGCSPCEAAAHIAVAFMRPKRYGNEQEVHELTELIVRAIAKARAEGAAVEVQRTIDDLAVIVADLAAERQKRERAEAVLRDAMLRQCCDQMAPTSTDGPGFIVMVSNTGDNIVHVDGCTARAYFEGVKDA